MTASVTRHRNSISERQAIAIQAQVTLLLGNLREPGEWDALMVAGTDAVLSNLQGLLASAGHPLLPVEITWINDWNAAHHLGLTEL